MNPEKRGFALAPVVIIATTLAAYANSFRAPFIFDDLSSIVENPTIRQLWPLGRALSPPSDWGFTVSGRPLLNFSFALNYAASGLSVWSYHALNLLIHVLAGLALFGLARRTFARPPLAARFGAQAEALALLIAVLWTVHPLQTESVTYIVQRAESLMGLFFLLTLYAFVRAIDSLRPRVWQLLSFFSCLLGVGTKEVAALIPIMVVLYDRTFVSGGFREGWRRHRGLYLGLAATWLPLAFLLAGTGGNRGGTIGFDVGVSWTGYWLTQFEAVSRYLMLSFWPDPLVFDYGKLTALSALAVLPWAVPVVALMVATAVALRRWPVIGFLGAWFFLLLAPTSLAPGKLQMIVDHRMYLPLAAVIALPVGLAAAWFDRRVVVAAGFGLALATGVVTARRNAVYLNETTLWETTIAQRPENARAHNNLGLLLFRQGNFDAAIARYRESIRLDPDDAHTHYNLGLALMRSGRVADAVAPLAEAVRILPYFFTAQLNLGMALTKLGRPEEALAHLAEAIRYDPSPAEAHFQLGVALAQLERWPEAIAHYAQALQLEPTHAAAQVNWGVALLRTNSASAAIGHFEEALRLNPNSADGHFDLGLAFASVNRPADAISHYAEAVRIDPDHADAQLNLGIALAQQGQLSGAINHLQQAVRLRPDSPAAQSNLGTALIDAGRPTDALAHYETVLRLQPDDAQAHYNVGYALLATGRGAEAKSHLETALRLRPDLTAARDLLQRLQPNPPTP